MFPFDDTLAVSIKAHVPGSNVCHEPFCLLEFAVAAKHAFDEFNTAILTHHLGLAAILCRLPHEAFTAFEEVFKLGQNAVACLEEVVDKALVIFVSDATEDMLGTLAFTRKLDKQ